MCVRQHQIYRIRRHLKIDHRLLHVLHATLLTFEYKVAVCVVYKVESDHFTMSIFFFPPTVNHFPPFIWCDTCVIFSEFEWMKDVRVYLYILK